MSDSDEQLEEISRRVAMLLLEVVHKSIRSTSDFEDLRPPQAMFLMQLAHRGPETMTMMARHARIHPTVVTRFLDRLEKKGFVERFRDESDRRLVRVDLTVKGRETADALMNRYLERLQRALSEAEASERDTLVKMLVLLDEALSDGQERYVE